MKQHLEIESKNIETMRNKIQKKIFTSLNLKEMFLGPFSLKFIFSLNVSALYQSLRYKDMTKNMRKNVEKEINKCKFLYLE